VIKTSPIKKAKEHPSMALPPSVTPSMRRNNAYTVRPHAAAQNREEGEKGI